MQFKRKLTLLALLLLLSTTRLLAQGRFHSYLLSTDAIIEKSSSTGAHFTTEVAALQKQNDDVALRAVSDKYVRLWSNLLAEAEQIDPPKEATKHLSSLKRLLNLRKENNEVMLGFLGSRLALIQDLQKLKQEGATDEVLQAHLKANPLDRERFLKQNQRIRKEIQQSHRSLLSERAKLDEISKIK